MGNVYTFLKKCKLVEPRGEMETPAGMTRTCCREAEGRGLSRLHFDTTAVTMPAISTAISQCAGRCGDKAILPRSRPDTIAVASTDVRLLRRP